MIATTTQLLFGLAPVWRLTNSSMLSPINAQPRGDVTFLASRDMENPGKLLENGNQSAPL